MKVNCSGIIEKAIGIDYCFKEIEVKEAIRLQWVKRKQIYDIYFCSFNCLHTFIHYTFWDPIKKEVLK